VRKHQPENHQERAITDASSPPPPPTEYRAVVFTTNSGRNGEVWQVAAYGVRFA
jgi:hypothetical protein